MSRARLALVAATSLAAAACTSQDGRGWATLRAHIEGSLEVDHVHEPSGGETLVTDMGYPVSIVTLTASVERLELLETVGDGGGGTFDPANPPPGYSLCHGGHCHAADGSLVDYEAIQAQLDAGGASTQQVAESLAVSAELDLLTSTELEVGPRQIGTVSLTHLRLTLGKLRLAGQVQVEGATLGLDVELTGDTGIQLASALAARLGRGGHSNAELAVELALPATFLDGIHFANLESSEGAIRVASDANPTVNELLLSRLAALELTASLGEHEHEHEHEHDAGGEVEQHDPLVEGAEHGCVHFQTGPFIPITVAATSDASPPEVEAGHGLLMLTLTDVDGGRGGYVELHAHSAGEVLLLLSKELPLELEDSGGAIVAPEQTPDLSDHCGAVSAAFVFHLEAAGPYLLKLGPDGIATSVDLLIIELEEHEHEHD